MHNIGNRSVYTGELRSRSSPLFALPGYGLCASTSPKPCELLAIAFFLYLASRGRRGRRSRGGRGGSRRRRREGGELRSNKPLQARHEHRLRVGLLVHAAEKAKGDRANLRLRELGQVDVHLFAVELHQRGRREVYQLGVGLALALLLGRLRQRRNLRKVCCQLEGLLRSWRWR